MKHKCAYDLDCGGRCVECAETIDRLRAVIETAIMLNIRHGFVWEVDDCLRDALTI